MENDKIASPVDNNAKAARGLVRGMCYLCVTTVGMAAIAAALLAGPLEQRRSDDAFIVDQHRHINKLRDLYAQQEELLANANRPAVIERVAVANLNYVPAALADATPCMLPTSWPELENALKRLDEPTDSGETSSYQHIIRALAVQPLKQAVLLGCGALLVLTGLTFFYRSH